MKYYIRKGPTETLAIITFVNQVMTVDITIKHFAEYLLGQASYMQPLVVLVFEKLEKVPEWYYSEFLPQWHTQHNAGVHNLHYRSPTDLDVTASLEPRLVDMLKPLGLQLVGVSTRRI